jgi:hypothetical protein
MSDELKLCPFCGSKETFRGETEEGPIVVCAICEASGPILKEDDSETFYWNWNTRPIEDALRAEVERMTTAGNALISAMEMQEGRLAGSLHIINTTARSIWDEAKDQWCKSIERKAA